MSSERRERRERRGARAHIVDRVLYLQSSTEKVKPLGDAGTAAEGARRAASAERRKLPGSAHPVVVFSAARTKKLADSVGASCRKKVRHRDASTITMYSRQTAQLSFQHTASGTLRTEAVSGTE